MKTTNKTHYVYKITCLKPIDERLHYIGVHSTEKSPENDNYWGSSKFLNKVIEDVGLEYFSKEVLSVWDTRLEASQEELRIHHEIDVSSQPSYFNKSNAHAEGFCVYGYVAVRDTRTGEVLNVTKEDYWKYDHYQSLSKDYTTIYDIDTKETKRVSVEDYNNTPTFKSISKGKITVKDIETKRTKQVTVEEYYKNPKYKTMLSGKVMVNDTRDNKTKLVTQLDYRKYSYYEAIAKNTVVVIELKTQIKKRIPVTEYRNNKTLYRHINTGKVVMFDKNTQTKVSITKEHYAKYKEDYESLSSNKVTVFDKLTKTGKRITVDEFRDTPDRYAGTTTGYVPVRSLSTGKTKSVSIEEFETNDDLVTVSTNIIHFYNSLGEYQFSNDCQIDKFLKSKNMPVNAFKVSYRSNGSRLYMTKTNESNWSTIKKKGYSKFKGWYAIKG